QVGAGMALYASGLADEKLQAPLLGSAQGVRVTGRPIIEATRPTGQQALVAPEGLPHIDDGPSHRILLLRRQAVKLSLIARHPAHLTVARCHRRHGLWHAPGLLRPDL